MQLYLRGLVSIGDSITRAPPLLPFVYCGSAEALRLEGAEAAQPSSSPCGFIAPPLQNTMTTTTKTTTKATAPRETNSMGREEETMRWHSVDAEREEQGGDRVCLKLRGIHRRRDHSITVTTTRQRPNIADMGECGGKRTDIGWHSFGGQLFPFHSELCTCSKRGRRIEEREDGAEWHGMSAVSVAALPSSIRPWHPIS